MQLLDLTGTPYERGLLHGSKMAPNIKANVQTYLNRFLMGGAPRDVIFDEAKAWTLRFENHDAGYFEEMKGIADGSGISLAEIGLLNARYELSYTLYTNEAAAANDQPLSHEPEGCTAFGIQPEYTSSGATIMGQNWDWLEGLLGNMCLLRVRSDDHPAYLVLTQAGIVSGMIGLNEHGIGLCVNGLSSKRDGTHLHHRPFHIRVQDIMRSTTMNAAMKIILSSDRVCSTNWMLGCKGGEVLDIETSPDVAHALYPKDGLITHGNHFINQTGIETEFERIAPCSLYRTPRLERLIRQNQQKWDMEHLKATLKDGFGAPKAICRYPNPDDPEEARTVTVASVVMDLDNLTMDISDGPPDASPYKRYSLS
ncbi:C45 family autoproteolytic acyltransferase/hydolase [Sneathiella sp.]|jgi:isopenicillin-N N-acyltransferase-like protein|uniref:C45 family autoproteolytic acyltransferase/hydolase n=1 Tax=Sneathiella sp. TaxID=1964365 RepID=UPI0039E65C09